MTNILQYRLQFRSIVTPMLHCTVPLCTSFKIIRFDVVFWIVKLLRCVVLKFTFYFQKSR